MSDENPGVTPPQDAVEQIANNHAPVSVKLSSRQRLITLLGPAFVAAVAYVDPGNVAANITAGARYGYLLVWVLVLSNLMAVLIQYQSAKLGIVTGKSLPEVLGSRLSRPARLAFWTQAEIVAAATDLAEIIGGAIALNLLFGVSLFQGGLIIGAVSMAILFIQEGRRQRSFEFVIITLLLIITVGFMGGLFISPPDWGATTKGLLPRLQGTDTVIVAASMLGATVMPHAIYLHSSLVRDRHNTASDTAQSGKTTPERTLRRNRLLRATRLDVVWALVLAGAVNIGLLLLAASALGGVEGTDTIEGAHAAITNSLGPAIGAIFAVGLLASGLASTSVGAYAGSEIMAGLLHIRVPLLLRRLVTMIPALVIIALGIEPTWALVVSQVVLSFGIPLAIIPLAHYTASAEVMGSWRDGKLLRGFSVLVAALIVSLNVALIILTFTGVA